MRERLQGDPDQMRVALVHHWFVSLGGGERVAEAMAAMYPEADIFTLVAAPEMVPESLRSHTMHTSFLNRLPFARNIYRHLLPLYPMAVEQLDLTGYDLVLTSDSGPMKGVILSPSALHVCYCHAPMRYIWDQYHEYRSHMGRFARASFGYTAHYVRGWDHLAAQRVTQFAANSHYVASRIRQYYGRSSTVIYPPIDTASSYLAETQSDAYLTVGRLVSYKRIDLLIQACNKLSRRLRIIGTGPEEARLRSMAGKTIEFLGNVDNETLWNEYANCRAFLFAANEDFGMALVEAQACGRPVIALGKGGALESVVSLDHAANRGQSTGMFFGEQTPMDVQSAILRFEMEEHRFNPHVIRQKAQRFGADVFRRSLGDLIDGALHVSNAERELQLCL
ncbi:glycosyltransferase involved in cell wall biosynthesis [Silvibacterium bohemicum]|uniref:Glycosyltransferase involved in cell wall biosynthesis n=1 Tax=Silvibacterium bohemicum TaxID=1577686 RepID=A0A841K0T8_9BACT|nr:glycosyltransferase [Silvibacterium bohemicum]MBB6146595.1 glycosyltransferase involved in cell wall biosynthesis [Silvibacterium bohemicum]